MNSVSVLRWFKFVALALAVSFSATAPLQAQKTGPNRKVHVVLVGVTEDKSVGKSAAYNIEQMKTLFEGGLKEEHLGTVAVIKGKDVTARNILNTIDALKIGADEALFVYCHIHGGYDAAYQFNDASQGHFLWLGGGGNDLMRKDLWQHMRGRKAALTALVTESCYNRSQANPFKAPEVRYEMVMENPALVSLMLNHRGYIDVNACSKDESSWNYGGGMGSMFTNSFVDMFYPHPGSPIADRAKVRWSELIKAAGAKAGKYFLANRQTVLNNPDRYEKKLVELYRAQSEQRAAILQMSFQDEPLRPKVPAIIVGQPVKGRLTDEDARDIIRTESYHKVYQVPLEAGKTYVFEMESKLIDAFLRLESDRGTVLAEDDDSAGNLNARIFFRPETSGTYYVIATTFKQATGDFVLRAWESGALKVEGEGWYLPLKITLDDPMDRVRTRSFHKVVDVQMVAGRMYTIDLQSATLDAYLRLEDAAGTQLAFDDDSGGGLNARLEFIPTKTATYRIIATTFVADTTGDMLLRVRQK